MLEQRRQCLPTLADSRHDELLSEADTVEAGLMRLATLSSL